MEDNVILQVLAEQKEEILNMDTSSLVPRFEESLFEFDSALAQVVIGVRRSGKSTLCHKALKSNNILYAYANLDDDRLYGISTEDLNKLLCALYQIYGTDIKYVFLDEIQNVDGWHLFVNRLLRSGMRVFVTGSNAKLLSSELATHLTGRYNEIKLYPFSFAEYCKFHNVETSGVTTKADAARKIAFNKYLHDGGFPELQSIKNKRAYIQSLITSIIQKDIKHRFNIRNAEVLQTIANHFINNNCQEINYKEIAKQFELSATTIAKYVDYLKQAFLICLLSKHTFKSKERLRNQKSYVVDTGIIDNREDTLSPENLGWRLENVVFIELLRRAAKDFQDVYFYKPTTQSKEVDFAVCRQGKVVELVQVAYDISTEKSFKRETSALVNAASKCDCEKLTLIAFNESREVLVQDKKISIQSAIDWMLN